MSKFYPDVRDEDGVEAGANWGAMAAIILGFLALLGAVPSFYTVIRLAGIEEAGPLVILSAAALGVMVLEAIVCFLAAWRFMQRKGLVIGVLLAVLTLLDLLAKLVPAAFGAMPVWQLAIMILYLPILYGLFVPGYPCRAGRQKTWFARPDRSWQRVRMKPDPGEE